MLRRPHSVFISPYDPQKNVWVVDDYRHAIFKFTNDGKKLLQTIGEPNDHASDDKHFYRPTFMAWQPDGSFYVSDGYANTRVVKFDKDGKYLTAWGERGTPPNETRPNYFNNVHGVTVDPATRQVYVNDRGNLRIQVFDENGKFLRMFKVAAGANLHFVHIDADRRLWVFDNVSQKLAQYDLEGRLVYAWGSLGSFPGRALGRPRHQRGPGTEPVPGRGWSGRRAEVPSPGQGPTRRTSWASTSTRRGNDAPRVASRLHSPRIASA